MRKVRAIIIALMILLTVPCSMVYAAEINDNEIVSDENAEIMSDENAYVVDDSAEILPDEISSGESTYIANDSAEILPDETTYSTYPDDENEERMEISLEPIAERLDDIFMQLVAMNIILAAIFVYLFIHNAIKTTFMK